MAKIPQTPADLKQQLGEQLRFIKKSADDYDKGETAEAKRIAGHVRTLIHETQHSKSLLGQLGEQGRSFYDTSLPDESGNLSTHLGLIKLSLGPGDSRGYIPRLDNQVPDFPPRQVPLDVWWTTPIFRTETGHILTRRDLVLSVADQDGGVHVDPMLNEQYGELSRGGGTGWKFQRWAGKPEDVRGAELAAVRQIGHEVLKTFDPSYQCGPQRPVGATFEGVTLRPATPEEVAAQQQQNTARPKTIPHNVAKVGRNQPCPCGSGKKFKRCCGR